MSSGMLEPIDGRRVRKAMAAMAAARPEPTDVEKICHRSVYDAGRAIRRCGDAGLLKRALKYEFEHRRRKSLIKLFGRRVKQLYLAKAGF
jgi:hypothetical protein